MWDVEPTLVWRVKRDGKWRYEKARWAHVEPGLIRIEYPRPPVTESDETEGESE